MNENNFLTEHYELYVYNDVPYFFTWENWSLYGGFTFFYDDVLLEITAQNKFKKDSLYNISLFVDRNPDEPNEWYRYVFDVTEISQAESVLEVEQIATEVRAFSCQDSMLVAEKLEKLGQLLRQNKLKTPI